MRLPLALLLSHAALFAAGPFSFGVKGGIALNDLQEEARSLTSNPGSTVVSAFTGNQRYTFGTSFDLALPTNFGIEVDALYRRYQAGLDLLLPGPLGIIAANRASANSLEFPILLKYKFSDRPVRPYVAAGGVFRRLTNFSQVGQFVTGNQSLDADRNSTGFVAGGGVEFNLGLVRISPELRFTRYGVTSLRQGITQLNQFERSQADVLIGITF